MKLIVQWVMNAYELVQDNKLFTLKKFIFIRHLYCLIKHRFQYPYLIFLSQLMLKVLLKSSIFVGLFK